MTQNVHYLIIGNGRTALHFHHYFSLLGLSFDLWHRRESIEILQKKLKQCTHILILISDQAIESFITTHLSPSQVVCIHFSGALSTPLAYSAHPLMSFSKTLYELSLYSSIPFIIEDHAPPFSELLPGLPNNHGRIPASLKERYHALCVLSGNFSCMLWQKLFSSFEEEFHLPASLAHPYLLQQTKNLIEHGEDALTGPLVRQDTLTIKKNLSALGKDPFADVYRSFILCYQHIKKPSIKLPEEQ